MLIMYGREGGVLASFVVNTQLLRGGGGGTDR